jgi:hypothetical protein
LNALAQAGYTDDQGRMTLDIMVLPHGGSGNNITVEFFRRIKARRYVISNNGTFGNPKVRTFEMIFEARRGDSEPFSFALTYSPEEYTDRTRPYPLEELCGLLRKQRKAGTPFEIFTPKKESNSLALNLLSDASFTDNGTRSAACGI